VNWSGWVTFGIFLVACAGGFVAWVLIENERKRRIRVMVNLGAFAPFIAMAPLVFHQAGGIEAEVNGPLWALWIGFHFNFVFQGALLLRNVRVGYTSPLIYIAILAILSHLVLSTTDKQSSRLYTTLITLAVTYFQDVVLRALFGDPQDL
jgi:hypothetical protein